MEPTNYSLGEVALEEMLAARERRVMIQQNLIRSHRAPVISFTLNIPGPVKVFDGVPKAFENGCLAIEEQLRADSVPLLQRELIKEKTGFEAFFCVAGDAKALKSRLTELEEQSSLGRLYDIDVIKTDSAKVSREDLGLPSRTCLLCNEPAHACSRSRRHSVEELLTRVRELLGGKV